MMGAEMTEGTKAQRRRGATGWIRAGFRVAVCLACGGVLTTLVAGACLAYMPVVAQGRGGGFTSNDGDGRPPASTVYKPGELHVGFGVRQEQFYWVWIPSDRPVAGEPSHLTGAGFVSSRAGWPMLAFASPPIDLTATRDYDRFVAARQTGYALPATGALPSFIRARPFRPLATDLIPLGFVVNTLLYAAVTGAMLFGPGAVRRGLRRRGGRCVGCGYPLTGGERCPECGDEAPREAVRWGGAKGAGVATGFVLCAAASGCQWNTSAFSLAMTDAQIEERVGERLAMGMDGAAVQSQLDGWRLRWRIERQMIQPHEYDPELASSGIVAFVEPHGLYWAFKYLPYGELWFYFEKESGVLRDVQWRRSRSRGAGLHDPLEIPLRRRGVM